MHIYRSPNGDLDLPQIDLLTFLFDSSWSRAVDTTEIHVEAANPQNSITKSEARALIKRIAYALRHDYGIGRHGPGKDVVLFSSSGNAFAPVFFYALVAAGGVFSAASTAYSEVELVRQAKQGGAKLFVCSEDQKHKISAAAKELGFSSDKVLILDYSIPKRWKLSNLSGNKTFPEPEGPTLNWPRITDQALLEGTDVCLLYSSGTTGLPKGVPLSHWNCVQCCLTFNQTATQYLSTYEKDGERFEYRTIAHLPIAHIAGVHLFSLMPFAMGGTTYWMQKYSLPALLNYSKRYKTTYQFTVPPIWLQIAKSKEVSDHFDTLKVALTGAAPMGPEVQAEVSQRLGKGKCFIGQTWGATEMCGSITGQPWHIDDKTGSVGYLGPNVRARIVDEEERDVEPGNPGEVLLQGPGLTRGYHRNEEANRSAFLDGWYRTGDVALIRDDKVYIVDRKKEIIKYKGLQVAPAELEALLISHPKILDAAVIGIQSKELQTEVPRAYVVANRESSPNEQEVKDFVKTTLAPHKQLRGGVIFLEEIPKSPSGKILRRELRLRAAEEVKVS